MPRAVHEREPHGDGTDEVPPPVVAGERVALAPAGLDDDADVGRVHVEVHATVVGVRVADLAVVLGGVVARRARKEGRVIVLEGRAAEVALRLVGAFKVDDEAGEGLVHGLWADLGDLALGREADDPWP